MIHTENMHVQIGDKHLLFPLNLSLEANKLHLILGPNGAGKSTLIKVLSGQTKPSGGKIFYADKNLASLPLQALARQRAVLSQSTHFAFPISVEEVVMMGRYPHFSTQPNKADREIVTEVMLRFQLGELVKRDYTSLSGGEQQRVQFARIMAQIWPENKEHRILFLDEPLTYLDVKHQYDFLHQLRKFLDTQNLTVVGVLHDLNLAARFADNLILLKNGRCLDHGSPREVLTHENVTALYDMEPKLLEVAGNLSVWF
jgi:iron complex transport system ATP-binding protein